MTTDTDTVVFTKGDVLDSLTRAVREYGDDWVDPHSSTKSAEFSTCKNIYTDDDGQVRHCIAAWVVNDLLNGEVDLGDSPTSWNIRVTIQNLVPEMFDDAAINLLLVAQSAQDRGAPWGSILAAVKTINDHFVSVSEVDAE